MPENFDIARLSFQVPTNWSAVPCASIRPEPAKPKTTTAMIVKIGFIRCSLSSGRMIILATHHNHGKLHDRINFRQESVPLRINASLTETLRRWACEAWPPESLVA